jgi:hypothetical protein
VLGLQGVVCQGVCAKVHVRVRRLPVAIEFPHLQQRLRPSRAVCWPVQTLRTLRHRSQCSTAADSRAAWASAGPMCMMASSLWFAECVLEWRHLLVSTVCVLYAHKGGCMHPVQGCIGGDCHQIYTGIALMYGGLAAASAYPLHPQQHCLLTAAAHFWHAHNVGHTVPPHAGPFAGPQRHAWFTCSMHAVTVRFGMKVPSACPACLAVPSFGLHPSFRLVDVVLLQACSCCCLCCCLCRLIAVLSSVFYARWPVFWSITPD